MSDHYAGIAFTADVEAAQEHYGSREAYAGMASRSGPHRGPDALTAFEEEFIAERDGFYIATISQSGWPYVQFRGGPPGFLRVLDDHTLGWADFRGNVQYLTVGNLAGEQRASLFLMDYARRRRLKLFGLVSVVDAADDPALLARLTDPGYPAVVERAMVVAVQAYDWNCPRHITRRFTLAELGQMNSQGRERGGRVQARRTRADGPPP